MSTQTTTTVTSTNTQTTTSGTTNVNSPSVPMKDFQSMMKFRFWCFYCLPMVYDDSLSYYELLNKVVNYTNHMISDIANMGQNVNNLIEAYILLEKFVNTTFEDILSDFADSINNGLLVDAILDKIDVDQIKSDVETQTQTYLNNLETTTNEEWQTKLQDFTDQFNTFLESAKTQLSDVLDGADVTNLKSQIETLSGTVQENTGSIKNNADAIAANTTAIENVQKISIPGGTRGIYSFTLNTKCEKGNTATALIPFQSVIDYINDDTLKDITMNDVIPVVSLNPSNSGTNGSLAYYNATLSGPSTGNTNNLGYYNLVLDHAPQTAARITGRGLFIIMSTTAAQPGGMSNGDYTGS